MIIKMRSQFQNWCALVPKFLGMWNHHFGQHHVTETICVPTSTADFTDIPQTPTTVKHKHSTHSHHSQFNSHITLYSNHNSSHQ